MGFLGLLFALILGSAVSSAPTPKPVKKDEKGPESLGPDEQAHIAEFDRRIDRARVEAAAAKSRRPRADAFADSAGRRSSVAAFLFYLGGGGILFAWAWIATVFPGALAFALTTTIFVVAGCLYAYFGMKFACDLDDAAVAARNAVYKCDEDAKAAEGEVVGLLKARADYVSAAEEHAEKARAVARAGRAAEEAGQRALRAAREQEQAAKESAQLVAAERDRALQDLDAHRRAIARLEQKVAEAQSAAAADVQLPAPAPHRETKLPSAVREALDRLPVDVKEDIERRTEDILLLTTLGDVKRQILEVRRSELRQSGASERDIEADLLVLERNLEKLDDNLAVERGLVSHGPSH